jgi:uncharacterized protein
VKKVDSVIRFLLPKEEAFHQLLDQGTENLVHAVRIFSEIAHSANLEERRVRMIRLKALEHDGDMLTKQVFDALNASFITPFDRDDIQNIAIDLDDVLDNIEGAAQYLILFELHESPDALRQFSDILVSMAEEIHQATGMIWDQKNERRVREVIVRVSELENQADQLYNTVIADLFKSTGRNPLDILKWKEVYQGLEEACDSCRDYSNIISNVVVKNA